VPAVGLFDEEDQHQQGEDHDDRAHQERHVVAADIGHVAATKNAMMPPTPPIRLMNAVGLAALRGGRQVRHQGNNRRTPDRHDQVEEDDDAHHAVQAGRARDEEKGGRAKRDTVQIYGMRLPNRVLVRSLN
jgi:hypothetical protein